MGGGGYKASYKALLTGGVQAVPPICGYTGAAAPQEEKEAAWLPLQALPQPLHSVVSAIRIETMSESEFQHRIVQAIIKHQFNTLTHTHTESSALPPAPERAEQPLPFPVDKEASTKGQGRVRIENRNNKKSPLSS